MPDIETAAERAQQIVKVLGSQQVVARRIRARDRISPRAGGANALSDREVLCLLGQPEGTLTTGTAKGTAI